jgi:hypothetical protein
VPEPVDAADLARACSHEANTMQHCAKRQLSCPY